MVWRRTHFVRLQLQLARHSHAMAIPTALGVKALFQTPANVVARNEKPSASDGYRNLRRYDLEEFFFFFFFVLLSHSYGIVCITTNDWGLCLQMEH